MSKKSVNFGVIFKSSDNTKSNFLLGTLVEREANYT